MQVCTIARARATIGGPMRESRTPCNAATFHCTTTLSLALAWPITPTGQIRTGTISKDRNNKGSLDVDVEGRGMLAAIGILPPVIVEPRIHSNHLFSQRIDSATASRASVLARRDSHLGPPFRAKGWSASEKDAVVFGAELREVCHSRRGIRFKVEAVSSILRRTNRDGNRC